MDRLAVQPASIESGSAAALRSKHLIAQRIVDHACDHLAVLVLLQSGRTPLATQHHAEHRKAMREVRRPVQRIDVPAILAVQPAARSLFAVDRHAPETPRAAARRSASRWRGRPPSPGRRRPCTPCARRDESTRAAALLPRAQSPQPLLPTQPLDSFATFC